MYFHSFCHDYFLEISEMKGDKTLSEILPVQHQKKFVRSTTKKS